MRDPETMMWLNNIYCNFCDPVDFLKKNYSCCEILVTNLLILSCNCNNKGEVRCSKLPRRWFLKHHLWPDPSGSVRVVLFRNLLCGIQVVYSACACWSAVACVGGGFLHKERWWYLSLLLEQKCFPQAITSCFILIVNFPQDCVSWKGRTINQMLVIGLHVFEHNLI